MKRTTYTSNRDRPTAPAAVDEVFGHYIREENQRNVPIGPVPVERVFGFVLALRQPSRPQTTAPLPQGQWGRSDRASCGSGQTSLHRGRPGGGVPRLTHLLVFVAAVSLMLPAARAASPEDGLIAVLTSTASVADKDAACRELKIVGTEKSVPALAALLTNEKLAHPARFALESMPYASAGAALRNAVGKTKGLIRSGMIDSLGERRDASAVPIIAPALNDSDDRVVAAAAWALGKIGTAEAAEALRIAHTKAVGKRRVTIGLGLLLCADNLFKAGKIQDAHETLIDGESKAIRLAAMRGLRAEVQIAAG